MSDLKKKHMDRENASLAVGFILLAGIFAVGFYYIMFIEPIGSSVTHSYNAMTQSGAVPLSQSHQDSVNDSAGLVQVSPIIALFLLIVWAVIEFRKGRDNEV